MKTHWLCWHCDARLHATGPRDDRVLHCRECKRYVAYYPAALPKAPLRGQLDMYGNETA